MEVIQGDMKVVVSKIDAKPGQLITLKIGENMKATEIGNAHRFAKSLAHQLPNNPIAVIFGDYDIGVMEPEEYEKLIRLEKLDKQIDGQITIDEYLGGEGNG